MYACLGTLNTLIAQSDWPGDFFSPDDLPAFMDKIYVLDFSFSAFAGNYRCDLALGFEGELAIRLPGLDGVRLIAAGGDDPGFTCLALTLSVGYDNSLTLRNVRLALRFDHDVLAPAAISEGDPVPAFVEIQIEGTLRIDDGFDITLDGFDGMRLTPAKVGSTGLVIAADGVRLDLSRTSSPPEIITAGFDDAFLGVFIAEALVRLPDGLPPLAPQDLKIENCAIGSGGFSGTLSPITPYNPVYDTASEQFTGTGACEIFGVPFGLTDVYLEVKANCIVAARFGGKIKLPFFDALIAIELGMDQHGKITASLAVSGAIAHLDVGQVMSIDVDSLGLDVRDGILTFSVSGKLTPTFGGLHWPAFEVKALEIDSRGHVHLSGGWIDLPKQYSLDFKGFKVEITKFGFGRNHDGSKWIGFSGGVELVKGLPAGASVEGLRITADSDWSNPRFSFNGVGIELSIPGVLTFKGEVAYSQDNGVNRFDGDISLNLEAIDLQIDGMVVAGSTPDYNFFALYVSADLPAGFPIGPSGMAIYGMAGLLALQMGPYKGAGEPWYGFGTEEGWYDKDPEGIENLHDKWTNIRNSRAFGAGVTLGTLSDNGYTFNGRVLLAVILPGPVVMLQGRANVLTERAKLTDEAMFRSLAVFDKPAGSILFGVDAEYQYDKASGKLIKIHGSLEAYYNYHSQSDWHLWLGRNEPRQDRIQARVLDLFDANAYLMLDSHHLAMGSWIGYDKGWQFGPLSVKLEAWMENNAVVSFKPAHLHGDLWVHGAVALHAFKFGAGLNIDARIEADVIRPFHLLGDFRVSIKLPKPFKSIGADVRLEWGPAPDEPPTPVILKEVAIEHLKSTAKWPLPKGDLLVPDYEDGNSGFLRAAPVGTASPNPAVPVPVVPVDCRPSIAFARNVWDRALTGTLPQPAHPDWERIGDPSRDQGPARVQYSLQSVELQLYDGMAWISVASTAGATAPDSRLFGAWQVTDAGGYPAQNRLLLWSKSGYDLYRNTGAGATTQLATALGNYPCFDPPGARDICLAFENLAHEEFRATFSHPDDGGVTIGLAGTARYNEKRELTFPNLPGLFGVAPSPPSLTTVSQVFCPMIPSGVWIGFAQPAGNVRITAIVQGAGVLQAYARDSSGVQQGPFAAVNDVVTLPMANVQLVDLVGTMPGDKVCLARICVTLAPSQAVLNTYADLSTHNNLANVHWSDRGNVLEPNQDYRLVILTSAHMIATDGSFSHLYLPQQYAYFRTAGPPGTAASLSVPIGAVAGNFDSGLTDLRRYVAQTVPPTVPAVGQPPLSPRPVYCGYDVTVVFNEDYVSLMYRKAGRDLALLLYDPANQPVRDQRGALVVSNNGWGTTSQASLSATDQAWLAALGASLCVAAADPAAMPPDETLAAAYAELAPDTRYEARLVPTLVHEAFDRYAPDLSAHGPAGHLGRWQVQDLSGGSSWWQVQTVPNGTGGQRITQRTLIGPATLTGSAVAPGGTLLNFGPDAALASTDTGQPALWSDYRVSLWLRTGAAPVAGIAFRHVAGHYYLFTLDGMTRNLVRVVGAVTTPLASDAVAHDPNRDYHVVVEALGPSIRVYVDDVRVFDCTDTQIPALEVGGIALHTSGGGGAAFTDVQVHDFSAAVRPVYSFSFVTSPYLNFRHHLHSFNDGCWQAASVSAPGLAPAEFSAAALKSTATFATPVAAGEALAFDQIARDLLGTQADQCAARVEIHRADYAADTRALLVRGPQPFGFARADIEISMSAIATPRAIFPLQAKLEMAVLGAATPASEIITLLLREATDLSGWRVEQRDYSALAQGAALPNDALDDPASTWLPLFEFSQATGVLPAGHRAVILACGPDAVPALPPKSVAFFRAATGQPGSRTLTGNAADLRLVDATGEVVHSRRFLTDSAFGVVSGCTFLRKDDESAFLILKSDAFAPGTYRLRMAFYRDASATLPDSPILAEAGDSSIETATLDFSWTPFG